MKNKWSKCPHCGEKAAYRDKFCMDCGVELMPPPPPPLPYKEKKKEKAIARAREEEIEKMKEELDIEETYVAGAKRGCGCTVAFLILIIVGGGISFLELGLTWLFLGFVWVVTWFLFIKHSQNEILKKVNLDRLSDGEKIKWQTYYNRKENNELLSAKEMQEVREWLRRN